MPADVTEASHDPSPSAEEAGVSSETSSPETASLSSSRATITSGRVAAASPSGEVELAVGRARQLPFPVARFEERALRPARGNWGVG